MAIRVNDVSTLNRYLNSVVEKARHHAPYVQEVVLTLAGAVVLYKDPDEPLQVRTRSGSLANEIWAIVHGNRYAFAYNHRNQSVEIRRGSQRGRPVASFNNTTAVADVIRIFENL